MEATLAALVDNGCDFESMIVGTYDTSQLVYDAIASGTFHFAISKQPEYQGSISVMLASLYVTTGQTLARMNEGMGIVASGPLLISIDNLPSNLQHKDRSIINVKVLTHDLVSDPFWNSIYSGLNRAASDFGVNLGRHRFKSAISGRGELSLERSFFVREACRSSGVDDLIVSLPTIIW